jgi:16S rRNA (adenine1518-N6/adenine1519-N6)-dimethyltransferase
MNNKCNFRNSDGLRAKKSLGQNFCKDERIPEEVLELLGATDENEIWEIGPGKGALTEKLLLSGAHVTAFEIDERLQEMLLEKFPGVNFIWGDFLEIKPEQFPPITDNLLVTGNLPYYCGTPIIRSFLEKSPKPKRMVFLLQEEVSKKAAAPVNSSDYGFLSLQIQFYAKAYVGNTYPPESFTPRPKINSTILVVEPYNLSEEDLAIRENTLKFASIIFQQKRKMALPLLKKRFNQINWDEKFEKAGIDPKARPGNISIPQLFEIFN